MFDWVLSVIEGWGYPGIFALMLAENVFPPIPSEVIMPLAGYLAATGQLAFLPTVLIGMLGSVIGTSLWYVLGAWIGAPRLKRWAARHGRWLTVSPGVLPPRGSTSRSPTTVSPASNVPVARTSM